MKRRTFLIAAPAAILGAHGSLLAANSPEARPSRKDVMLMERIGPTASELYIAHADGSDERKLLSTPAFEYHASFSFDGSRILLTSEPAGRGQADIYVARLDGSGLEALTSNPTLEDAAVFSPDGSRVAFVSTRETHRANIWILDLKTHALKNLTGAVEVQGDPGKPDGFFRPAWSPNGKWIAFSSDRNTEWKGHICTDEMTTSCSPGSGGEGWEHIQQLSIYVIGVDGKNLRRVASAPGRTMGSPKWSKDGNRIVFYDMPVIDSWNGRISFLMMRAESQIVTVDLRSGERVVHTSGPGLKLFPQFLSATEIGYHVKAGKNQGLYYISDRSPFLAELRSPAWSPDGSLVVYEKTNWQPLAQNSQLYSWDTHYDYRSTDSFPRLSNDGKLVITEQAQNSSIATMNPDGSERTRIFDAGGKGLAFAPCWSPDSQWIAFGYGEWFEHRSTKPARLMRVRRDGTGVETLLEGVDNAGFPSFSSDGKQIVFRLWTHEGAGGLRILNLDDRSVRVLTKGYDNLPDWSPDGHRIVFTRRLSDGNFDVFTLRPDGGDLRRLTTSGANDAHAVWTADGKILWTSGAYGFKEEAALYDNNFQPYGQIWIMDADGSNKRSLTDSIWEDAEPLFIPNRFL